METVVKFSENSKWWERWNFEYVFPRHFSFFQTSIRVHIIRQKRLCFLFLKYRCWLSFKKPTTVKYDKPLSMSSAKPSGNGHAFMKRRLCLLGDLDRHIWLDSSVTVSRYDTTGSDFLIGMQAWSSSKSFKQISRWSSPAPATMCSPLSSVIH